MGCVWQGVCTHCWGVHLGVGVTGSVCDSSSGWQLGIQAGFVGLSEQLPPIPPSSPIPDHVFTAEGGGGWRRGRGDTFPARYLDVQPPLGVRPGPSLPLPRVCPACVTCILPVPAASSGRDCRGVQGWGFLEEVLTGKALRLRRLPPPTRPPGACGAPAQASVSPWLRGGRPCPGGTAGLVFPRPNTELQQPCWRPKLPGIWGATPPAGEPAGGSLAEAGVGGRAPASCLGPPEPRWGWGGVRLATEGRGAVCFRTRLAPAGASGRALPRPPHCSQAGPRGHTSGPSGGHLALSLHSAAPRVASLPPSRCPPTRSPLAGGRGRGRNVRRARSLPLRRAPSGVGGVEPAASGAPTMPLGQAEPQQGEILFLVRAPSSPRAFRAIACVCVDMCGSVCLCLCVCDACTQVSAREGLGGALLSCSLGGPCEWWNFRQ